MDLSGAIAKTNERLRAGSIGVSIEVSGCRLCLRATLPPRPGNTRAHPYQQRLYLGHRANLPGLKAAEDTAKIIGGQLSSGRFDWADWLRVRPGVAQNEKPCKDWVSAFEEHYFSRRKRTDETLTTWRGDYLKAFKRLPPDAPLSVEVMTATILATQPDTKTRKRVCMAIGALANFAGLQLDVKPLSGKYSPVSASPRNLPSDADIARWYEHLKNPAWKWVYGMLATYGLRNHEVFRLDFNRLRRGDHCVDVLSKTKTGSRQAFPFYPEWFDVFDLAAVLLPPVDCNRPNQAIGHAVTEYLADAGLPFSALDLRHAWAVRTIAFSLPVELAARQMGHSVIVHTGTYHHWITEAHQQQAYEAALNRSDRPSPPGP
jgi:integrase